MITYYTRGSEIISLSRPGEKHYYLHDGHGTVRALSDADGQVTDTYLFDAFGNLLSKTGTTANDFLYTGEQYDISTGFYYLRARYMNPSTGTFTQMDAYAGTIFDPVSLHKYLYANANPVMNRDPSGYYTLTEMESAMAIQAIIGGAMNGTTKAVLGAIGYFREGGRFNMDFVGTFMSDFIWGAIDGAIIGGLFGAFGYLATQSLLASFLLRSFFGTMGVKSAWDFIRDLRRGDYGRAILDGLSAVLFFWGASQNYYRGGGLGNHGGNQGKNNPADDVADDAANLGDDAANTSQNLYDGARMSTDDALTAAEDFLGTGYGEIAPGVFRSSDGLRQVRMTVSDLAGHGIDPHMNFEVGISTTNPGGRVTFIAKENMHIFIEG